MKTKTLMVAAFVVALAVTVMSLRQSRSSSTIAVTFVQLAGRAPVDSFLALTSDQHEQRARALRSMRENWSDGDAVMMIEAARFARHPGTRAAIFEVLAQATHQDFGVDIDKWYRWIWNRDIDAHPNYATFKKKLYSRIDPRFAEYFSDEYATKIRLDEIRWGGVRRDGIPPLKNPETLPAAAATYLADSDIVFGVQFGGQSRAYPKRILAWHEMVKDVVGGQSINGVYCTLCGSMIVYRTELNGKHYELGTSGFLYRSNKLMYDRATKSMWSTLRGAPVVGPLVGKGIELEPLYVVTTTWGKWKQQHPDTDVLSLETGHRRDYGEGVAYRNYFATDQLMFTVPGTDLRLKNKDEVLIVRGQSKQPLAIAAAFLNRHRIYQDSTGKREFVVLTDDSGANRVYHTGGYKFAGWADAKSVESEGGKRWRVTEDALVPENDPAADANRLARLPAHRAFWFAWYAAFPNTRLVK